jgi:peptidyl-prolyl cis-trans isomerase D
MLETIRKYSSSIVIKVLFALLILSFLTWGVGDFISSRSNIKVVAEVGSVDISPTQVNREFVRDMSQLERVFGTKLDREQARALGVADRTIGRIVSETLYNLGARSLGVIASDAAIRTAIERDRSFADQTGKFNRSRFQQILMAEGYTEQGYIARLREEMVRVQLGGTVVAGVVPPKSLVDAVYRHRAEKRVAQTLFIADATMTDIPEPTAEQLAAFHTERAEQFTAPEYRRLTVIDFRAKDLEGEVAIDEQDIRDQYAQRQEEFNRPEMRHLRQIVVPDEAKAKEIRQMLGEGRDFMTVAKESAGLDEETVDLGEVSRSQLLQELADAAFSLPDGAISEPVESPLGWHLIQVASITPAHHATIDDARPALTAELRRDKSVDALFNLANRLEDTLGGGATVEEAAKNLNLRLRTIEAIDATGKDPDGKPVADLPAGGRFLETAFETPENQDSLVTEASSDAYFVVHVDKVTPSALRPLDGIRDQVATAWKTAQREAKAKATADVLVTRLKDGEDIGKIAGELRVEVKTTEPFTRQPGNTASALPRPVVAELFKAKVGGAAAGRGEDGYVVARLQNILPADPAADADGVAAVERSLADSLRGDIQGSFASTLRQEFPVTINRQALEESL